MSPTDSVQPDAIFATPFRARPDTIRTYSHRRGSNARSLPQLKPQTPPTRPRPRLSQTNPSLAFSSPGATLVPDNYDANAQDLGITDTFDANIGEPEQETRETDIPTHDVDDYEDVYDPNDSDFESEQDSRDIRPATEISDTEPDSDDGVDHISSQGIRPRRTPSQPTSRPPAPTPSRARSTRRVPYLIFNKTPRKSTSFKKLEQKQNTARTSYLPGDGFSDTEARPNGLFQLTKKKKLHFSVPAVGTLDLTQAAPTPTKPSTANQPKEPRIIFKRKKRVLDNSFLPPTPKKPRRERRDKQKEPDTQPIVSSGLSAPYGQVTSSVILGESPEGKQPENEQPEIEQPESEQPANEQTASLPPNTGRTTATENTNCTKNDAVEPSLPPPVDVSIDVNAIDQVIENDIIEQSSDLPARNTKEDNSSSQEIVYIPETSQAMSMPLQPHPLTEDIQAGGAEQPSQQVSQHQDTIMCMDGRDDNEPMESLAGR